MPDTTPTTDSNPPVADDWLIVTEALEAAGWTGADDNPLEILEKDGAVWAIANDCADSGLSKDGWTVEFPSDTPVSVVVAACLAAVDRDPARLVLDTTDQQPETAPACPQCGDTGACNGGPCPLTETAPDDRRDRYAALFRSAPGEARLGDATPGEIADAVMAIADTERENDRLTLENNSRYIKRLDTEYDSLRAELEAHRLALSDALGLGTGAPWDAIRDAAAGYRRTLAEADQRKQEYKQACIRLRAEVEQLRTDRAAVLREAADAIDHVRATMLKPPMRDCFAVGLSGAAGELRRMADEAQQPTCACDPAPHREDDGTYSHWVGCPIADAQQQADEAQQPECTASISGSCLAERQSDGACDTEASECVHGGRPADEAQQPEPEASPTAVLLAAYCYGCEHTLATHLRYGACLHDGCTCHSYQTSPRP